MIDDHRVSRDTDQDVDALARHFPNDMARDASGAPLVAWRDLVAEVEEVFTLPHLETQPDVDVAAVTAAARTASDAVEGAARKTDFVYTFRNGGVTSPLRARPGQPRLSGEEVVALEEVCSNNGDSEDVKYLV